MVDGGWWMVDGGLGIILQGKVSPFFFSVILIPWVQLFESQLVLTMD